jgi:hypothetical protein
MATNAEIAMMFQDINCKLHSAKLYENDNRAILIQWIYEVLYDKRFVKVTPCTHILQMTMIYVDAYAVKVDIDYDDIQLLGATCLWIALKITETRRFSVKEICEYCDFAYEPEQFIEMEKNVCKVINWDFMSKKTMYENCIEAANLISPDIFPLFEDKIFKTVFLFFNDVILFKTYFSVWDRKNVAITIILLTVKFWNQKKKNNGETDIINSLDFSKILDKAESINLLDCMIKSELEVCDMKYIRNSEILIPYLLKTVW